MSHPFQKTTLIYVTKNWLFFFISITFLLSCSKDDPATKSGNLTESFSINNDQLRPLQIVSVHFNEENLSSSEYYGSLGDHDVTFEKVNAKTLAFIVPKGIAPGDVELRLNVSGTDYLTEASILKNISFTDPQRVYEDFYQEFSTDEFLNVNRQQLDEAKSRFESLSEENKMEAAQMLINNRQLLNDLKLALISFYSGFPNSGSSSSQTKMTQSDKLAAVGLTVALVGALISSPVVAAVGAGITVGLALEVVVDSLRIVMNSVMPEVNQALEMTYGLGYNRMAYTTELVYDAAERRIFNKQQELPSQITLREKESLNLSIQLVTTPLVSEKNRDEYNIVDKLLNSISTMREMLSGYYEVPAPSQEEYNRFAESLEGFSVSVNNTDVQVSELSGNPENASIYFETEKLEDQEFTFTYSYTNEKGETSSINQGIKLDVGYNVVLLNGNGLPSPLEWINNTPKSFKIVDYKGDDLEYFDVSKLSIQNVSNQEVNFHIQKDGVFNNVSGGEYFEIIPLTDLEEVEVEFELYYEDVKLRSIQAIIVQSKNGLFLENSFYPLPYGYVTQSFSDDGNVCPELKGIYVVLTYVPFEELSDSDNYLQLFFTIEGNELVSGTYSRSFSDYECRSFYAGGDFQIGGEVFDLGEGTVNIQLTDGKANISLAFNAANSQEEIKNITASFEGELIEIDGP